MGKDKDKGQERPSYRQALEAIGWYFDQQLYRGIFVAEIDEGYVGKARPAEEDAELHGEGFTFPHDDVQALMKTAAAGGPLPDSMMQLCPGGYNTFMRAVGEMYDRMDANYVSVLEVTTGFVLGFTTRAKDGKGVERRRHLLDRAGIEDILNRAGV